MEIEYFGTKLDAYGHYRFKITEPGNLDYDKSLEFSDLDFDPYKPPHDGMIRGNFSIYKTENHIVGFFKGSPHDKRLGTVSVFFTKDKVTEDEFLDQLRRTKFFNELVDKISQ